jgi:hypothetical protein
MADIQKNGRDRNSQITHQLFSKYLNKKLLQYLQSRHDAVCVSILEIKCVVSTI